MNEDKQGRMPILKWLKIEDIRIPELRLRSHLPKHVEFEESVKANGVIQPVHVFEDKGVYWLADGQNRLETAKRQGMLLIAAFVGEGSMQDAVLHSAKLNVLRGKVNLGELAEFLHHVKTDFGWTVEKTALEFNLSKSYVSQLLRIAENPAILEKLKNGLISFKEARNEVLSLHGKPISEEKPSFEERSQKQGVSEKPSTFTPTKQPLTDEDLGITTSLKQAMEEGKRFKPLGPEEPEEEENERKGKCAICNEFFTSKKEIAFILVHKKRCANKLWDLIMKAEREAQNEPSQP